MQKHSQSGRSIIEMLAVLAIIGVIVVGAIAGINQAIVKYRISKTYTEVRSINQSIASLYSYLRTYPTTEQVGINTLCENQVFPSGCQQNNTFAPNPFGGGYGVTFNDAACQDSQCMTIEANNVPEAACSELLNLNWGEYLIPFDGNNANPSCSQLQNGVQTFSITLE